MLKKSETNNAIVCKLENVRKHSNADRLKVATVMGDQVIVELDSVDGDLVIYFDSNLALSPEYLKHNNEYSQAELNTDTSKKGYFGKNGRVRAQSFRGEKSYGYVAPIKSVTSLTGDVVLKEKDKFQSVNGIEICFKYVPPHTRSQNASGTKKKKQGLKTSMFPQHWDTKQFRRESETIPDLATCYIEEKYHGTSGRIGKVLVERNLNWFEKILKKFGVKVQEKEYMILNGSRRVNLTKAIDANPFYKGTIREKVLKQVYEAIYENEQLFFEIVGYDTNGAWIQKGFSYGCVPNTDNHYKVILYRVTMNNDEGKVVDMDREYVYKRAEQLGMLSPLKFTSRVLIKDREEYSLDYLTKIVEQFTDSNDNKSYMDMNTMLEGVVVWFMKYDGSWGCLKSKSYKFLEKESKLKDAKDYVDIEEST